MKKTLFTFILIWLTLIGCCRLWAADSNLFPKPIKDFIATPPRDILNDNLAQAKQQLKEQDPSHEKSNADQITLASQKNKQDAFINPFVPQIPQPVKTTSFVNPQTTAPTTPAPAPTPEFIVTGLVWNSKKPEAIVNGQIVFIGDHVSNWAVSEISKNGVCVSSGEQNLWVKPIISPEGQIQPQPTNPYRR